MPDSDEHSLLSGVCHYVKLMSITWILASAPSSDWTQSIDLHLLSVTEMVQSPFIAPARSKQRDMFHGRNVVAPCASAAPGGHWRWTSVTKCTCIASEQQIKVSTSRKLLLCFFPLYILMRNLCVGANTRIGQTFNGHKWFPWTVHCGLRFGPQQCLHNCLCQAESKMSDSLLKQLRGKNI